MNELIQQENLLIGNKNSIAALESTDHGRILLVSDSHGRRDILLDIIMRYGPSCHCFAFCGDGLSDIAYIFGLAATQKDLQEALPPVKAIVAGNCDPSSYPLNNGSSLDAPYKQIININGQHIMITHGHKVGVSYGFEKYGLELQLAGCKTGLFGHTHVAEEVSEGGFKFINPGSCSNPRGGQPAGFAILTVEKTFVDTAFIKIDKSEKSGISGKKMATKSGSQIKIIKINN